MFEFPFVELYGASHLYVDGKGTELQSKLIQGDDTGYIHVAPSNTLRLTGVSSYRRTNVTWAPYIYRDATFVFPNATLEFRQANSLEYPALTRSSNIDFWGRVVGDLGHLLVGYGTIMTFTESCHRSLKFVGVTIQKTGRLQLESAYGNHSNDWEINIGKDIGPLRREGKFTIEGGGIMEARRLGISAQTLEVKYGGLLALIGKGFTAGECGQVSGAMSLQRAVLIVN